MSFLSWPFSWRPFRPASIRPTKPSSADSRASCNTETPPSKPSALRRPSLYLFLSSAFLLVSGILAVAGKDTPLPSRQKELLEKGWIHWDGELRCAPPSSGNEEFFALESEEDSFEAYRHQGSVLVSRAPDPGFEYSCRPVSSPHFIQEIL